MFGRSSVLVLDIGGTQSGLFEASEFDSITVTSIRSGDFDSIQLNGALVIKLVDEFEPQIGDRFPIIVYESAKRRTGEFQIILGLDIGNGKRFEIQYSDTEVVLETVASN